MICIDTNILSPAVETGNRAHSAAAVFLTSLQDLDDVVVAEFVENGVVLSGVSFGGIGSAFWGITVGLAVVGVAKIAKSRK